MRNEKNEAIQDIKMGIQTEATDKLKKSQNNTLSIRMGDGSTKKKLRRFAEHQGKK